MRDNFTMGFWLFEDSVPGSKIKDQGSKIGNFGILLMAFLTEVVKSRHKKYYREISSLFPFSFTIPCK